MMVPHYPKVGISIDETHLVLVLDSYDNIEICLKFLEIIKKKAESMSGDLLPSKHDYAESDLLDITEVP